MKKKPTRKDQLQEPVPKPDAKMEKLAADVERDASNPMAKEFVAHLRERGLLKGKAK